MMTQKLTRFCITQHSYDDDWINCVLDGKHTNVISRLIMQEEMSPTTGNEHLQMYVETHNRFTFMQMKTMFGFTHIEGAKGTRWENYNYCTKPERTGLHRHIIGEFKEPRCIVCGEIHILSYHYNDY